MTDKVAALVTTKSDAELAAEFKRRLVESHEPVLKLLGEISRAGFEVGLRTAPGPLGNWIIAELKISKVY